jgi:hypothetical protein
MMFRGKDFVQIDIKSNINIFVGSTKIYTPYSNIRKLKATSVQKTILY